MTASKRAFDLIFAGLGLIVLAPVAVVVSWLIHHEDSGPVLYRPMRVGHQGRPFRLYKFRTMVRDAASLGGPLTVGADARITKIGATLRRWKLDELPQLINVIRGEMSLVGPRPEDPELARSYSPEQRRVFDLMPGITDPASIRFVEENALLASVLDPDTYYLEHLVPEKVRLNLDYSARATVLTDARIVMRTFVAIWR